MTDKMRCLFDKMVASRGWLLEVALSYAAGMFGLVVGCKTGIPAAAIELWKSGVWWGWIGAAIGTCLVVAPVLAMISITLEIIDRCRKTTNEQPTIDALSISELPMPRTLLPPAEILGVIDESSPQRKMLTSGEQASDHPEDMKRLQDGRQQD